MSKTAKNAVFSSRERMLLSELVKENGVVEDQRKDSLGVTEKNRAWEFITASFNSHPEVNTPRNSQQLRKLWTNLKHRKCKETKALRHERLELPPGNGPAKRIKIEPELEFVSVAAPNMDVSFDCPFDSNHLDETVETRSSSTLESTTLRAGPSILPSTSQSNVNSTARQQQELHNLKKQISEEELLRVREERKRLAHRDQLLEDVMTLNLQRAKLELRKASDEAKLASLKLKQFECGVLSEDP